MFYTSKFAMGLEHLLKYISIKADKSNYEEVISPSWFGKSTIITSKVHLLPNLTITKVKNLQEEIFR